MSPYQDPNTCSPVDDLLVIEDAGMWMHDEKGNHWPGYQFIDHHTVRAHPVIIDVLLKQEDAECLWTLAEALGGFEVSSSGNDQ